jgi:hypothetical protein
VGYLSVVKWSPSDISHNPEGQRGGPALCAGEEAQCSIVKEGCSGDFFCQIWLNILERRAGR